MSEIGQDKDNNYHKNKKMNTKDMVTKRVIISIPER